ncbi:MAG: hypothetical protein ACRER6_10565 [Pseudomonas sp.]|jgi:hypothetical protein
MGRTRPSRPQVIGRDGRQWLFDEQGGALERSNFSARAIDLPNLP